MVNWDWTTFIIGVITGAGVAVLSGFFGEAGKDLYSFVHRSIWPGEPEPKRVSRHFNPEDYVAGSCVWAKEHGVLEKLDLGYTHYLSSEGAPVYRFSSSLESTQSKEFLMVAPDAQRIGD